MGKGKTFLIGCIAGSGGILYGYDQGIISSTIAQTNFTSKFNPTPAETGGVVSGFSGGAFCGAAAAGYLANKVGRKRSLMIGCIIALLGCGLQTGAVNIGMLIVGRVIAGISLGFTTMICPMYNAEIAHPNSRGLISGIMQQFLSFGFVIANWVGYGVSFMDGDAQWRVGLSLQLVWATVFLIGLFFVPYSPRWLMLKGRKEEAKASLMALHYDGQNQEWVDNEYREIEEQVAAEQSLENVTVVDLVKTKPMLKRTALAVGIQWMTQMTGINVINYYGPSLYKALGYSAHDTLLINGLYGIIGPIVCAFGLLFLIDRFGRRPILLVGTVGCCAGMAIEAAIQHLYPPESTNRSAHKAGVGAIAIFSVFFSFSYGPISWIYAAEIWPNYIRHLGVAAGTCGTWAANVLFGQTGSLGIDNLGWSYYLAFCAFNIFNFFVILFFFPETRGVTLEAMAEKFGDSPIAHKPLDASSATESATGKESVLDEPLPKA